MNDESRSERPAPPYSAGGGGFTRPIFQAASNTSRGKRDSRSHSLATGMIRSRAKRRAVSMRARCSSVGSKSIIGLPLLPRSLPFSVQLGPRGARAEDVPEDDPDHQNPRDEDEVLGPRHADLL